MWMVGVLCGVWGTCTGTINNILCCPVLYRKIISKFNGWNIESCNELIIIVLSVLTVLTMVMVIKCGLRDENRIENTFLKYLLSIIKKNYNFKYIFIAGMYVQYFIIILYTRLYLYLYLYWYYYIS